MPTEEHSKVIGVIREAAGMDRRVEDTPLDIETSVLSNRDMADGQAISLVLTIFLALAEMVFPALFSLLMNSRETVLRSGK